jgi:hypothetical protein
MVQMRRMTWRAISAKPWVARRVTGCHLTQETRVQQALDDVAGNKYARPCSSQQFFPTCRGAKLESNSSYFSFKRRNQALLKGV